MNSKQLKSLLPMVASNTLTSHRLALTIMSSHLTRYYTTTSITCKLPHWFLVLQMLDDRGNTAVYLLYAYTHVRLAESQ